MGGAGVLTITYPDETQRAYVYPHEDTPAEVVVAIGQIMQWQATDADLTFYEICEPPYQPGRYTDLPAAEE